MPAGLIPALILGGIATGGQVAGAVIGAKASKKAGQQQVEAENQALALQKQVYEEAKPRYQPYQDLGQSVLPTLRGLAGNVQAPRFGQNLSQLSVYGAPPPPFVAPSAAGGPSRPPVGVGHIPDRPESEMVQLQAPNGTIQAVDRRLVDHYVAKGAKVIG